MFTVNSRFLTLPRAAVIPIAGLIAGLVAGLVTDAVAAVPAVADQGSPCRVVDVRAAQHEGYDRLVFEFEGALPEIRTVEYVDEVVLGPPGAYAPLVGNAFLYVYFAPSANSDDQCELGDEWSRMPLVLPTMYEIAPVGPMEESLFAPPGPLDFGIGLTAYRPFTVFHLYQPSRLVIDVDNTFTTVQVKSYFIREKTDEPTAVLRPVVPPATGRGALQRLFAGPTAAETYAGLEFPSGLTTGFTGLTIAGGIARVRLAGGCSSLGRSVTIADSIIPTLKQFPSVQWVKIYD
ncbi:MAG: GerMN domain-containing protein, partial [Micromonosporaceae bacterium]|nr:GerMN domain-containing protein [Micromonosporaceae bacterium]